jgi:prohibitin 1
MEKFFNRVGKVGAGLFATGLIFSRFVFVVDGGERGVVFDRFRGVVEKVYGEGMHFIIPLIQVSRVFDSRIKSCKLG